MDPISNVISDVRNFREDPCKCKQLQMQTIKHSDKSIGNFRHWGNSETYFRLFSAEIGLTVSPVSKIA